jgi:hypothetical protein
VNKKLAIKPAVAAIFGFQNTPSSIAIENLRKFQFIGEKVFTKE